MSSATKDISDVLLFKEGAYWFTREIWGYWPGGANDHNLHLLGYEPLEQKDWYYYGIERDGFESPSEAFAYLAYARSK